MTSIPTVFGQDFIIDWVERQILSNGDKFDDGAQAMGFCDNNRQLVAGIVYHNYSASAQTIEMSAYSSRRHWTTGQIVKLIFDYPFDQLGCRLVVARHSQNNKVARRIWNSLGAAEYIIPELRGAGEAEAIAVLSRDTWEASKFKKD